MASLNIRLWPNEENKADVRPLTQDQWYSTSHLHLLLSCFKGCQKVALTWAAFIHGRWWPRLVSPVDNTTQRNLLSVRTVEISLVVQISNVIYTRLDEGWKRGDTKLSKGGVSSPLAARASRPGLFRVAPYIFILLVFDRWLAVVFKARTSIIVPSLIFQLFLIRRRLKKRMNKVKRLRQ